MKSKSKKGKPMNPNPNPNPSNPNSRNPAPQTPAKAAVGAEVNYVAHNGRVVPGKITAVDADGVATLTYKDVSGDEATATGVACKDDGTTPNSYKPK